MIQARGTAIGVVCAMIILAVPSGYATYYNWTGRGDDVKFSASGSLGWGASPVMVHLWNGKVMRLGTLHRYLFVNDMHYAHVWIPSPPVVRPGPGSFKVKAHK